MKSWFLGLAPRERAIVAGGGAILALVLLYLAVVEPAVQAYDQRVRRVENLERQLAWMQEAAGEVQSLRAAGATDTGGDGRAPYLVVDSVLRGAGLPQPKRLESVNDGSARLEFDEVPFDPLVHILGRLRSESGIHATRVRITRVREGYVDASLSLERPQ